jgi:hypothetical protein
VPHTPNTGRVGRLTQTRPADDPELLAAREAVAAERAERMVRRIVADAPELDDATRRRLAEILCQPSAQDGAA